MKTSRSHPKSNNFPIIIKIVFLELLSTLVLIAGVVPILSQANSVKITPEHIQHVMPGRVIVYDHMLTNNANSTDIFVLEVSSTQDWPVELLGGMYPTGTVILPLQIDAQMTATFQVSLTVPEEVKELTEITVITATSQISPAARCIAIDTTIVANHIYLPVITKRWPPIPYTPNLNLIDNSDQDNHYTVSWKKANLAQIYILEEATNSNFYESQIVYQGNLLFWTVPELGKIPRSYYYRVKAHNSWGDSPWSAMQVVKIHPLFVGLQLRWDGEGYIRTSIHYNVGWHTERNLNGLTDEDTIRVHNYSWYDPNPQDWEPETWDSYYSVTTGYHKSSSIPSNPDWQWNHPWILPYDWQFSDKQSFPIDSQTFTITGPHSGYTAFGKLIQYWELVNKDKFLYWDDGSSWTQYVHPGDITLWYESSDTRLLLHRNILRHSYYDGLLTTYTIQYISNLTSANSFPAINSTSTSETELNKKIHKDVLNFLK